MSIHHNAQPIFNLQSSIFNLQSSKVFCIDLIAQFEPHDSHRHGLDGIGLNETAIDGLGEEVAGRQTGNDEHHHHERNVPARTLPRHAAIPQSHTHEGYDVGAVLRTGAEQHTEHQGRGHDHLAECHVLILVTTKIGQTEGDDAGDDNPQVGVGELMGGATEEAQQRDVG